MQTIITYLTGEFIKKMTDLQEEFYKNPEGNLSDFVAATKKETDEIARLAVQTVLQDFDDLIKGLPARKRKWYVDHKADGKKLLTSVGEITFSKTLYKSKTEVDENGKPVYCYLLDKLIGLAPNQTMTEDVMANIYQEAVQTSYRKGGELASPEGVTKSTVKKLLHETKFPPNFEEPSEKKEVDYLYIEADEDHYHLQFKDKKGDLEISKNGRKLNSAINKLIYVHEGIEPEAPKSKRYRLINPHYFCRGDDIENKALWDEVYAYIDATYDLEKVKKIYVNSDGGGWIKSGQRQLGSGAIFVLDEFHLSKYISKMINHMEDSIEDAREEIADCIRNKKKSDFLEIVDRLKACSKSDKTTERIMEAAGYIASHWTAAKLRLRRSEGVVGSSTEGHVYHVLSSRMSTLAMGWSRHGGSQMAHLREYYYNGGEMIELAKYQKEELPLAAGAEEVVLSANEMLKSERNRRSKQMAEYGKYSEAISVTIPFASRKQISISLRGKI